MKSTTPDCMKFKRLQRRLDTSKCQTVGMLELLWLATAKNAPQGDIGRFTNEEIAIECDHMGDPDELVAALLDCGWLDPHDECRLVVHDWPDHCPTHVRNNLKRWGKDFIVPPKESPEDDPKETPTESRKDAPSKPDLTRPDQTKPNPTTTKPPSSSVEGGRYGFDFDSVMDRIRDGANRLSEAITRRQIATVTREHIWQSACISEVIQPGMIFDIASKIREGGVNRAKSYIDKAVRQACQEANVDYATILRELPVAPERD